MPNRDCAVRNLVNQNGRPRSRVFERMTFGTWDPGRNAVPKTCLLGRLRIGFPNLDIRRPCLSRELPDILLVLCRQFLRQSAAFAEELRTLSGGDVSARVRCCDWHVPASPKCFASVSAVTGNPQSIQTLLLAADLESG